MGMGLIEDLLKMIFGMSNMFGIENVKVDLKDVVWKWVMVLLMIFVECENFDLLNFSCCCRIVVGLGNSVVEVNCMIK